MVAALHTSNATLVGLLSDQRRTVADQAAEIARLRADVKAKKAALDDRDYRLASLSAELEHTRWDMQQEVTKLKEQNEVRGQRGGRCSGPAVAEGNR